MKKISAVQNEEARIAKKFVLKIGQLKESGPRTAVAAAAAAVQNGPGGGDAAATPQQAQQEAPGETGPGVDHYKGLLERRTADVEDRDAALSKSER